MGYNEITETAEFLRKAIAPVPNISGGARLRPGRLRCGFGREPRPSTRRFPTGPSRTSSAMRVRRSLAALVGGALSRWRGARISMKDTRWRW